MVYEGGSAIEQLLPFKEKRVENHYFDRDSSIPARAPSHYPVFPNQMATRFSILKKLIVPICSTSFLGTLIFFLSISLNLDPDELVVSPNDPNIQYMGRWEHSDSSQKRAEWQGSSITFSIQGTGVSALLDGGSETEYFRIIINQDVQHTRKIAVTPGVSTYELASNLAHGVYTIELVKETYTGQGTSFGGLILEEKTTLLPPPTTSPRFISFYGDSNLAGYSLESEHNEYDLALRGSYFGLAGITSRMFGANYHNISISGARISTIHAVFDLFSHQDSTSTLDVSQYNPDAIIVNLGANDVGHPKEEIKKDYHRFLDTLRVIHPSAHIVLFNAWGWDYDEPANFTHEVVAEREDPQLTVSTFPWLFETWHGCEYDHAGMASVLASHLEKVLDWKPAPSDVMSGYGEHGDVANGGFERAAPFGGYGWRYFNVDGVHRVHAPTEAFEGSYYVSLTNGAMIHQPNPAKDGDEVLVHLSLRGRSSQDRAQIKIDFRDQKMWTSPLKSDSLIVKLTPHWTPYSMKVRAPIQGGRPVFQTRLTVGPADPTSQVDVDDISMSVLTP